MYEYIESGDTICEWFQILNLQYVYNRCSFYFFPKFQVHLSSKFAERAKMNNTIFCLANFSRSLETLDFTAQKWGESLHIAELHKCSNISTNICKKSQPCPLPYQGPRWSHSWKNPQDQKSSRYCPFHVLKLTSKMSKL